MSSYVFAHHTCVKLMCRGHLWHNCGYLLVHRKARSFPVYTSRRFYCYIASSACFDDRGASREDTFVRLGQRVLTSTIKSSVFASFASSAFKLSNLLQPDDGKGTQYHDTRLLGRAARFAW